jgi:phosphoglycolate phosphatase
MLYWLKLLKGNVTMNILFDLDGTLTDSGEGIINCAIYALEHFGLPVPERSALRVFVGPPLRDTFPRFGVPVEQVDEAIAVYRKRYVTIGKYENFPYPGIRKVLEELKIRGHRLFVATSKPEAMAIEILEHFELAQYFEIICGATTDDSRSKKEDVIAYLLNKIGSGGVMVGDTIYDVIGAKENNLLPVAVTWGYGNVPEMSQAGAKIVNTTEELLKMIEAC